MKIVERFLERREELTKRLDALGLFVRDRALDTERLRAHGYLYLAGELGLGCGARSTIEGTQVRSEAWVTDIESGRQVSSATCIIDWREDPYHLKTPTALLVGMAETRAVVRALMYVLSGCLLEAGYQPLPVEEWVDIDRADQIADRVTQLRAQGRLQGGEGSAQAEEAPADEARQAAAYVPPRRTVKTANGDAKPSEKQLKRLYAIAMQVADRYGMDKRWAALNDVLRQFGFERADEVTADSYDAVVKALQEWKPVERRGRARRARRVEREEPEEVDTDEEPDIPF